MLKSGPNVYPIPLRENVTVLIAHIPLDMTEAEAERVCRVVRALAQPEARNRGEEG